MESNWYTILYHLEPHLPVYNPNLCITRTPLISLSGNGKCYSIAPCISFLYVFSYYCFPCYVRQDIVKGLSKDCNWYCIDSLLQNWTLFNIEIQNRSFYVFTIGVLPAPLYNLHPVILFVKSMYISREKGKCTKLRVIRDLVRASIISAKSENPHSSKHML